MLHFGSCSVYIIEKRSCWFPSDVGGRGSPIFSFLFFFLILGQSSSLRFWAFSSQPIFLHPCILCFVKNKVVYQWKWSMAPAGLSSAKTSHRRKPLKHVLCYKQRWKIEVLFPDKRWMDTDGFVSSFCPLRDLLDFHLLPAVLQLRPAEEFIACIPSEESALSPRVQF